MIVWRVENEHGNGPYNEVRTKNLNFIKEMKCAHAGNSANPTPYNEGQHFRQFIYDYPECVFGFLTKDDAERWFGDFMKGLDALGYSLKQVEAIDLCVGRSGKQIVFIRKEK